MRAVTLKQIVHTSPHMRRLFQKMKFPRLALAAKRHEQESIKKDARLEAASRPDQTRAERDAERRFEQERNRRLSRSHHEQQVQQQASIFIDTVTLRAATPEECLSGDASFERAMPLRDWLSLHRATR